MFAHIHLQNCTYINILSTFFVVPNQDRDTHTNQFCHVASTEREHRKALLFSLVQPGNR